MEWNQIQKFMVAAREENFSRAAEKLYMAQPALSQTIKRLEEELGYPLFCREGKKIRLNASGRIFLQTAVQINELMENTKVKLEELNQIEHPNVTVHFSTASRLLPELLIYLKKRNPGTQYHIHQWQGEKDVYEDDIQILSGPVGSIPGITGEDVLLTEQILLAMPKNHCLLQKKLITLHDLVQEEFISLNESWELGRTIKEAMEAFFFEPMTTMIVDNPNMMRELLKAHLGIAFVPAISWGAFAGDEVVLRYVEGVNLSRCIYIRTKPGKYLTKEQRECICGIKEFFKYHITI